MRSAEAVSALGTMLSRLDYAGLLLRDAGCCCKTWKVLGRRHNRTSGGLAGSAICGGLKKRPVYGEFAVLSGT
jgi:hypothetical protein